MMRREIIVTTAWSGGVALANPAAEIMRAMSCGGYWGDKPRGFVCKQIESKIAQGKDRDASRRFCRALAFGGCTDGEALAILRDFLCGHLGTAHEIVDIDDVPPDRWFRDAWRRSQNGGPIYMHLPTAKRIQLERIKGAVERHNQARLALGRKPREPHWGELGNSIRHARDEDELRRVWPAGLCFAAPRPPQDSIAG
jgi:hypothetical protein